MRRKEPRTNKRCVLTLISINKAFIELCSESPSSAASWEKAHESKHTTAMKSQGWGQGGDQGRSCIRFTACAPTSPSLPPGNSYLACNIPYLLLQHLIGPMETTGHCGGADWGWPSSHMAPCTKMTLCTKMFPDCCRASREVKSKACNKSHMLLCWQEQWPLNRSQLCELSLEEEKDYTNRRCITYSTEQDVFQYFFFLSFLP